MPEIIYQWIDLLWLPVALLLAPKRLKIKSGIFVLTCVFTLRTQMELVESVGTSTGLINLFDSSIFHRGVIVYSIFIGLFLLMAVFSPKARTPVFMAAGISLYIMAFAISMVLMLL